MNDVQPSSDKRSVKIAVIVMCIVGAAAALLYSRPGGSSRGIEQVYFYDLGAGTIFAAEVANLPPIAAPSGGQAVRATVFGCGDCSAGNQRIGYLTMYTDAARALMAKLHGPQPPQQDGQAPVVPDVDHGQIEQGTLIAAAPASPGAEPAWQPMLSERGRQIIADAFKVCEGQPAKPCTP